MSGATFLAVAVIASLLMLRAGIAKRRLVWRSRCPSCGHPMRYCTCYWR
jgi:prepilin signal peptidase PulO-like enzyme (type II secretory pathway)